jgi:hypothetical protein
MVEVEIAGGAVDRVEQPLARVAASPPMCTSHHRRQ